MSSCPQFRENRFICFYRKTIRNLQSTADYTCVWESYKRKHLGSFSRRNTMQHSLEELSCAYRVRTVRSALCLLTTWSAFDWTFIYGPLHSAANKNEIFWVTYISTPSHSLYSWCQYFLHRNCSKILFILPLNSELRDNFKTITISPRHLLKPFTQRFLSVSLFCWHNVYRFNNMNILKHCWMLIYYY